MKKNGVDYAWHYTRSPTEFQKKAKLVEFETGEILQIKDWEHTVQVSLVYNWIKQKKTKKDGDLLVKTWSSARKKKEKNAETNTIISVK